MDENSLIIFYCFVVFVACLTIRIGFMISNVYIEVNANYYIFHCFSFLSKIQIYAQIEQVQRYYERILKKVVSEKNEKDMDLLKIEQEVQETDNNTPPRELFGRFSLTKPLTVQNDSRKIPKSEIFSMKLMNQTVIELSVLTFAVSFLIFLVISSRQMNSSFLDIKNLVCDSVMKNTLTKYHAEMLPIAALDQTTLEYYSAGFLSVTSIYLSQIYNMKSLSSKHKFSQYIDMGFKKFSAVGGNPLDNLVETVTSSQIMNIFLSTSNNIELLIYKLEVNDFELNNFKLAEDSLDLINLILQNAYNYQTTSNLIQIILVIILFILVVIFYMRADFMKFYRNEQKFLQKKNLLLLMPFTVAKNEPDLDKFLQSSKFKSYFS